LLTVADDGKLTAELAAIKQRSDYAADKRTEWSDLRESAEDVPRLVKALEAALTLAAKWDADAAELDLDIARSRKSGYLSDHQQADTDQEIAREYREHAGELREAIAGALAAEQETQLQEGNGP
jgi:hypothetical protein